ncbi:MAG: hypothetical protein AVDCRST_MAG43-1374 [uncultured Thermomicrobiales bacterium]|uniref:Uncharacterized protein n=1 Tax=uncultured Thermomicrobiales bacterium TaxID=1645740 RepID=A0A6J4URX3_9BACT|nr:MAG: hypothetical protein AVDCRST_MAG43-1374 [uncultured Thermomicrobiales bacterium]
MHTRQDGLMRTLRFAFTRSTGAERREADLVAHRSAMTHHAVDA